MILFWNVILHERIFINTWQKAWKWRKLLGVIQTCFKFQIFLTDLIPEFNNCKFLKILSIIKKVSFRLSSSFPPHWKLSLCCFNMFIAFNSFVHTKLGIPFLCCKVFEIVKVGSSISSMPTSGDLKWGDCLFFTTPQWEWLRTLYYDVLNDLHTIKIRNHRFDARNNLCQWLNTCKNASETVLRIRKIQVLN